MQIEIPVKIQNDLILKAARGQETGRTPVWLMRQAGRILPEYRKVRKSVSGFKELVQTPELACEVTLQPVDILGVDAAIIFSDILVIPEAMGLPYQLIENKGPFFEKTIKGLDDIDSLKIANPKEDLHYVLEAIRLTKTELDGKVPLIGFAGAPWTIFCYMLEGSGSKTFSKARKFLYTQHELAHQLLQKITDSTIAYLQAQFEAGADIVQLFDSWAGVLSPQLYKEFSLRYISQICDSIKNQHSANSIQRPVIVFAKGAYFSLKELGKLNCDVIGLDWNMDISESRKLIGETKTLQGNLDPAVLYADFQTIKNETKKMLNNFGPKQHIANLGHGVYPDTDVERVKCFIETIKEYEF
ncbi:MAG: uroporphyrinogen decarboxylase [Flavobacteriales bacterium]|nr:MAG: uroporphyrinogen decarboxylase [Flavobacteriales bacterium]